MKKIIVFDIDNTIYDNEQKAIHPSTIELIKKLYCQGDLVGIATGRTRSGLDVISPIKEYISFLVLANGMEVYYPINNLIYKDFFVKQDIDYFSKLLKNKDLYVGFGSDNFRGYLDRSLEEFAFRGSVYPKKKLFNEQISSFWLVSPKQELINKERKKILEKYDCFLWTKNGCDIVKKGHNKYSGLSKVLSMLNEPYQIICVGDGQNDLPLIKKANLAIGYRYSKSEEVIKNSHYLFDNCYSTDLYNLFYRLSLI